MLSDFKGKIASSGSGRSTSLGFLVGMGLNIYDDHAFATMQGNPHAHGELLPSLETNGDEEMPRRRGRNNTIGSPPEINAFLLGQRLVKLPGYTQRSGLVDTILSLS